MNLAILFLLLQTVVPHSAALAWDASTDSTPTNPGTYSVYRAPQVAGACGTYARIASGIAVLTFTDTSVAAGASYCYTVSFVHTESGQPISTESDPSTPPLLVTIPGTVVPPKPAAPTNLRAVAVQ